MALHHNHSISRALVDLFPDIALDISKLNQRMHLPLPSLFIFYIVLLFVLFSAWIDVGKRRRFFEAFASDNNFDPTDPEAWYLHWTKLWSLKVYLFLPSPSPFPLSLPLPSLLSPSCPHPSLIFKFSNVMK